MKALPGNGGKTPPIHPLWLSLASAALVVCIVGATEFAARRFYPEDYGSNAQYLYESSGPFFRLEEKGGRCLLIQIPSHRHFPPKAPQGFELAKPAGLRRIVVIGESSAGMIGASMKTEGEELALSHQLEIVNMGVGGADLEQTMRRFREALECAPDDIVVLFGHNLFNHYPLVELSAWPGADGFRLFLLSHSRLLSLFSEHRRSRMPCVKFRTPGRWLAFREALSQMADEARRRGIRLALCTVPGNLQFPPQAKEKDRWDPAFLEANYLYWSGRKEAAMRGCARALARRPDAWWEFQLGGWLYRAGRYGEARRWLVAARDDDPRLQRASNVANGLIRRVAEEKGLVLLDFERLVLRSAPHGIPGWESFLDAQHVITPFFWREASECLNRLSKTGQAPWTQIPADDRTFMTIYRSALAAFNINIPADAAVLPAGISRLAQARRQELIAAGDIAARAAGDDPAMQAIVLSGMADAFWEAGLRERALRLNDEARGLAPRDAELCVQKALFLLDSGAKYDAAGWLERALQLRPDHAEARFYLDRIKN